VPPRQPSNGNAPTAKQEAAAVHAEAARVVQTIPTIIKDMKNMMAKKDIAQPSKRAINTRSKCTSTTTRANCTEKKEKNKR